MKFKFDPLAWETEAWLYGTKAFLETIERVVSETAAENAVEQLKRHAESEGWEPQEYFDAEGLMLEKFEHWLPKLSAYSVIILMQSLVETQLQGYARRLRRERSLTLEVNDLYGKGFEQAKAYIVKVAGIDIAHDLGWQELSNLQRLRNIIVHRRGLLGDSPNEQELVRCLLKEYPEDLSLVATHAQGIGNTNAQGLLVTFRLCSHFLGEIEAFFQRLCRAAGLPNVGLEIE